MYDFLDIGRERLKWSYSFAGLSACL